MGGKEAMSRSVGTWGEAQVANFLRKNKCRLIGHSYHCRFGEIDLIAMDIAEDFSRDR